MIRTLVVTGFIAAFIGCAFVPPTDANFQSLSVAAKQQVSARTVSSLLTGTSVDDATIAKARAALQTVTPNRKKAIKRITSVVRTTVLKKTSAAWKEFKTASADALTKEKLETIEWASRKGSARLCAELIDASSHPLIEEAATPGDYLVLCLAKVTGDLARCDQIDDSAVILKKLCNEELAT